MKPATSIEKVYRVLNAFRARPSFGVTELAEQTDLLPSDVHRILRSLAHFGYVAQDEHTKKYRLGLELLKLGHLVGERIEFTEWPGQPTVAFPRETLENTFQTTMVRVPLSFTDNWRPFTTMGGSYVGGASRRWGDSTWVSLGLGWDASTNPVVAAAAEAPSACSNQTNQ